MSEGRQTGPFTSFTDFVGRTRFTTAMLSRLALADAFRSLGLDRRPAYWQSLRLPSSEPLFANLRDEPPPPLPRLSAAQEVLHDYYAQGLSLRGHPFASLRTSLKAQRVVTAVGVTNVGCRPELSSRRARPVAAAAGNGKGGHVHDDRGRNRHREPDRLAHVWERYCRVARQAQALIVTGQLQRQDGVTHIIVKRLKDITTEMTRVGQASRDFD